MLPVAAVLALMSLHTAFLHGAAAAAVPAAAVTAEPAQLWPAGHAACPALLDQRLPRLQDEAVQDLCQYTARVVLIVNTASFCGYTPQYRALEQLHERYRARGFVVLGFPSNDFGQEAASRAEIAQLCESTFGVKFPMFASSRVTGAGANPLFVQLAHAAEAPRWNFHKYLVGRDGRLIASHPSAVAPGDQRLISDIERAGRAERRGALMSAVQAKAPAEPLVGRLGRRVRSVRHRNKT